MNAMTFATVLCWVSSALAFVPPRSNAPLPRSVGASMEETEALHHGDPVWAPYMLFLEDHYYRVARSPSAQVKEENENPSTLVQRRTEAWADLLQQQQQAPRKNFVAPEDFDMHVQRLVLAAQVADLHKRGIPPVDTTSNEVATTETLVSSSGQGVLDETKASGATVYANSLSTEERITRGAAAFKDTTAAVQREVTEVPSMDERIARGSVAFEDITAAVLSEVTDMSKATGSSTSHKMISPPSAQETATVPSVAATASEIQSSADEQAGTTAVLNEVTDEVPSMEERIAQGPTAFEDITPAVLSEVTDTPKATASSTSHPMISPPSAQETATVTSVTVKASGIQSPVNEKAAVSESLQKIGMEKESQRASTVRVNHIHTAVVAEKPTPATAPAAPEKESVSVAASEPYKQQPQMAIQSSAADMAPPEDQVIPGERNGVVTAEASTTAIVSTEVPNNEHTQGKEMTLVEGGLAAMALIGLSTAVGLELGTLVDMALLGATFGAVSSVLTKKKRGDENNTDDTQLYGVASDHELSVSVSGNHTAAVTTD